MSQDRRWVVLALLGGCASPPVVDSFEDVCVRHDSACEYVEHRVIAVGDEDGLAFDTDVEAVVTTDGAWAELLALAYLEPQQLPAVDFTTHQLLVAHQHVASTCELRLREYRVRRCGSSYQLAMDVEDTSGACLEVCDASGGATVVAEVRNDLPGEVCTHVESTCQH